MKKYDAIVIGAGNGGLVAALRLANNGKKVLVLDKNIAPGGFSTSFMRGRFEFDASMNSLHEFGTKDNPGIVYKLFEDLNIIDKIKFVEIKDAYHVYSRNSKSDYIMPFGVESYIDKMEKYVPGSKNSLEIFFKISRECYEAITYLETNEEEISDEILAELYPNFIKFAILTLSKGLQLLRMPLKAQEILTANWSYFGSPSNTLSFVHFACMFYSYIAKGAQIPRKTSYEISLILAEAIEKKGGKVQYLSTVKEILFENNQVSGVKLVNGEEYYANYIICDISPHVVYGKMIPEKILPQDAIKLTNSRVLGSRGFSIYLGLNQSAEEIGLNDFNYFIYHTLNSNKEYENMNSIKNNNCTAVVVNNANPTCSPKGTCVMQLMTLFTGDCFDSAVSVENYFDLKEEIAENIINSFERTTGILIREYIEEIVIATPITFARYCGYPDGVIHGYKATGPDNLIPRIRNSVNENYIKGLRFCGSFGMYLSGCGSAYLSGNRAALDVLKEMEHEGENE